MLSRKNLADQQFYLSQNNSLLIINITYTTMWHISPRND